MQTGEKKVPYRTKNGSDFNIQIETILMIHMRKVSYGLFFYCLKRDFQDGFSYYVQHSTITFIYLRSKLYSIYFYFCLTIRYISIIPCIYLPPLGHITLHINLFSTFYAYFNLSYPLVTHRCSRYWQLTNSVRVLDCSVYQ